MTVASGAEPPTPVHGYTRPRPLQVEREDEGQAATRSQGEGDCGQQIPWRERRRGRRWSYGRAITVFVKEEEWRLSRLTPA